MYKVFIDTTDRKNRAVSLFEDKKKIDEIAGEIDVVVEIGNLLEKNNLKIEDIEVVDVNKGPGSFTGLKIGVTVANVLNWMLGKKDVKDLDVPEYGAEPNIHKSKWLDKV